MRPSRRPRETLAPPPPSCPALRPPLSPLRARMCVEKIIANHRDLRGQWLKKEPGFDECHHRAASNRAGAHGRSRHPSSHCQHSMSAEERGLHVAPPRAPGLCGRSSTAPGCNPPAPCGSTVRDTPTPTSPPRSPASSALRGRAYRGALSCVISPLRRADHLLRFRSCQITHAQLPLRDTAAAGFEIGVSKLFQTISKRLDHFLP